MERRPADMGKDLKGKDLGSGIAQRKSDKRYIVSFVKSVGGKSILKRLLKRKTGLRTQNMRRNMAFALPMLTCR